MKQEQPDGPTDEALLFLPHSRFPSPSTQTAPAGPLKINHRVPAPFDPRTGVDGNFNLLLRSLYLAFSLSGRSR